MPKKWTEEERKAASEKAKARWAAKRQEEVPTTNLSNEDVASLLRRIEELEKRNFVQNLPQQQSPQVTQGGMIGTLEKYIVDPKHYPDPRERLADEPRLQRFAFKQNYELGWEITSTFYETIDKIKTREPKFTLELNRIVFDDETGEPSNGRYTICRAVFHEDPQAAIVIARENGIEVDESNEKAFLDEMRYLRMRDWLFEAFYPPRPSQPKKNKREMVVGNKLVEYFEINSESSETIPFGELKTKV